MKSIFKGLLILALAVPGMSWATQGPAIQTVKAIVNPASDSLVTFSGAVSGTGSSDATTIAANGYAGAQFKFVKSDYRGTFEVDGSWDGTTFNKIWESSNDAAAVTETIYWQNFAGYNYYKLVGDPNASNSGTLTSTALLVCPSNKNVNRYTGYYGIHTVAQEILPSAARTADADTYVYTEGNGIEVNMNATAASSGSVVLEVYSTSPTGVDTKCQFATAITAAGYRQIIVAPGVAPVSTPAAVDAAFINNGTGHRWHVVLNEASTNSLTSSVFINPYKYNPPYTSVK